MIKVETCDQESIEIRQWDKFIERTDGNIFFVYDWIMFDAKMRGYKPYFCIAKNEDDIVGVAYFQAKTKKMPFISLYDVAMCGPIVKQSEQSKIIANRISITLEDYFRQKRNVQLSWAKYRGVSNADYLDKFSGGLFEYHTYLLDLNKDIDVIWRGIKKGQRAAVKQAKKNGVETVIAESVYDLKKYHELHSNFFISLKQTPYSIDYFQGLWNLGEDGSYCNLFIAKYNGEAVSGIFLLHFKKRVFFWNATTNSIGRDLRANHLLVWDSIEWAKNNGFEIYDFGGISTAEKKDLMFGVDEFKKSWGGESEVSYGKKYIYSNIYKNLLQVRYKLGTVFDIYRKYIGGK